MRELLSRFIAWLKSLGHVGHCYLCNKQMKHWSRGGHAYIETKGKKIYRALLCREHYEGYFNFPAVKTAIHAKLHKQLRDQLKSKSRKNPK